MNMEQVDSFLNCWNEEFPRYTLKVADLKDPVLVVGALFQVFERLGIDTDIIVAPPAESERDEHTPYYWDLMPVINMVRVYNHLVSIMPQTDGTIFVSISHFLHPTVQTSHPLLLILFNLIVFNEAQLRDISPYEQDMFQNQEKLQILEKQKAQLQELLNNQAKEEAQRGDRLREIDHDIKQFEDELKQEKEAHDEEKQDLEEVLKENQHLEVSVEQKRAHRDALVTEVSRKRALRVYDADDIRAQAEQATQSVQEAEEKLESLKEIHKQKEIACNNLQNIKPNIDAANNLLYEISKLSDTLKELEGLEHSPDEVVGELDIVQMEVRALTNQLAEVQQARREHTKLCAESRAKRDELASNTLSLLEEAERRDKISREESEKAVLRVKQIQRMTHDYEVERQNSIKQIAELKHDFQNKLSTFSEALLKKTSEVKFDIENKLKSK